MTDAETDESTPVVRSDCSCTHYHVTGIPSLLRLLDQGVDQWTASWLLWSGGRPFAAYLEALSEARRAWRDVRWSIDDAVRQVGTSP